MQFHSNTSPDVDTLAARARSLRESMKAAQRQHAAGSLSYEDLAAAARAFCEAFYAYQVAKFGRAKAKRLDYRAVLR
jgi:capsule polysaccharide export protein KpsE/RkpR